MPPKKSKELQSVPSPLVGDPNDPLTCVVNLVDKKVRNLEKRKVGFVGFVKEVRMNRFANSRFKNSSIRKNFARSSQNFTLKCPLIRECEIICKRILLSQIPQ